MRRAFAADEARRHGTDTERLERRASSAFDHRMAGKAEVIVIGEADEIAPLHFRLMAGGIGRHEERIVFFEIGFPGESKPFIRVVGEAVDLSH